MPEPENHRGIRLVSGYIKNVDWLDDLARSAGLSERFAIVLSTHRPGSVDAIFDQELFLHLLEAILPVFRHDSLIITMDAKANRTLVSFEELKQHYADSPSEDRVPFEYTLLKCGGEITGLIQTHFWVYVGGPPPYSDSYTIVVYTRGKAAEQLSEACKAACGSLGAVVWEEIAGLPRTQISFWARLKLWLI